MLSLSPAPRAVCGAAILLSLCFLIGSSEPAAAQGEVNVYSSRSRSLVGPLLKLFEDLTGVKTNIVYARKDLIGRVAGANAAGRVDVILANQFSQLVEAKERGLTQAAGRQVLADRIPFRYRDPGGHWFGLSKRVRIVLASKSRVNQQAFTYEELADPRWKGKICIRSGKHPYNLVLISSLIAHKGEVWTEKWLRGLKTNLAVKPSGGDRTQAGRVYSGKCDIAILNSYYVGAMMTNEKHPEQKDWVSSARVIFPNGRGRGAHMSVSGMALARNAPHRENGLLLMDFLTSQPAQFFFALENYEYPVRTDVQVSPLVAHWGNHRLDAIELGQLASLTSRAANLVDKIHFDAGPGQ